MTFSYDLDTPVGQIRLEIGDTDDSDAAGVKPPNGTNFTDEELTHFYTSEGSSVLKASAKACEVLARMWAGLGENVRIRDYSINTEKKAEFYRDLAADLRTRAGDAFAGGAVPTVRSDGYSGVSSEQVNSQQGTSGSEYWRGPKVVRWP